MRYVQLLRARRVDPREIAGRGAGCLELCKRVQGVVVIEIVVERRFLVVRPILIDADLELIAAIRLVRRDLHSAASARAGYVLQQAQSDRVETSNRNLIAREN